MERENFVYSGPKLLIPCHAEACSTLQAAASLVRCHSGCQLPSSYHPPFLRQSPHSVTLYTWHTIRGDRCHTGSHRAASPLTLGASRPTPPISPTTQENTHHDHHHPPTHNSLQPHPYAARYHSPTQRCSGAWPATQHADLAPEPGFKRLATATKPEGCRQLNNQGGSARKPLGGVELLRCLA